MASPTRAVAANGFLLVVVNEAAEFVAEFVVVVATFVVTLAAFVAAFVAVVAADAVFVVAFAAVAASVVVANVADVAVAGIGVGASAAIDSCDDPEIEVGNELVVRELAKLLVGAEVEAYVKAAVESVVETMELADDCEEITPCVKLVWINGTALIS